jgi:hypothetical protein
VQFVIVWGEEEDMLEIPPPSYALFEVKVQFVMVGEE